MDLVNTSLVIISIYMYPIFLEYCRYGTKLYPINQPINQSINQSIYLTHASEQSRGEKIFNFHFMAYTALWRKSLTLQFWKNLPWSSLLYILLITILCLSDLCLGVEKIILQEKSHFHNMTIIHAQHNSCSDHEIYNFGGHFLNHPYNRLRLNHV